MISSSLLKISLLGIQNPLEVGPHLLVDRNVEEFHFLEEKFHHLVDKRLLSDCHFAFDGSSLPSCRECQNLALEDIGLLLEDIGPLLEDIGPLLEDIRPLLEDMGHLLEDMGPLLEDIHQYSWNVLQHSQFHQHIILDYFHTSLSWRRVQ